MEELEAQTQVLALSRGSEEHRFRYLGLSYLYDEIIDLLMCQTVISGIMAISKGFSQLEG